MSAVNRYKLDGKDLYTECGFVPGTRAYATFGELWEPKERESYDWSERNGVVYNLAAPVTYKARTFVLDGYILANSLSDFRTKLNRLWSLVAKNGFMTLEVVSLGMTYKVLYTKQPKGNLRSHNLGGQIAYEVSLELLEYIATGDILQPMPIGTGGVPDGSLIINDDPLFINDDYVIT